MNKADLIQQIDLIYDDQLSERVGEVREWLRPGKMKEAVNDLANLADFQAELIMILQKELIDLRISETVTRSPFYPMSTTPKKRY